MISSDTIEKLYKLENKLHKILHEIAEELRILGYCDNFWDEAVPQAMFDLLNSHQSEYVIAASVAFLKQFGIDSEGKILNKQSNGGRFICKIGNGFAEKS